MEVWLREREREKEWGGGVVSFFFWSSAHREEVEIIDLQMMTSKKRRVTSVNKGK